MRALERVTPESVGLSSGRLAQIDAAMQAFVDQGKIAGVAAMIARRGQLVHSECYGWLDRAAHKPLQPDSLFRIYSLTKPVTSVAALMLYEEGRFDLDDPVSHWIPEFGQLQVRPESGDANTQPEALAAPITFRHLLTHTAGLGYGIFSQPIEAAYRQAQILSPIITLRKPLAEMIQAVAGLPLMAQPGTAWFYSLAHDVLGYLIGLISGQPFEVFLRERIFEPLGMPDTSFYVPPEKQARFGPLYSAPGEHGLTVVDAVAGSPFVDPRVVPSGGAGLVSSMADYLQFMRMLANGGQLNGVRLLQAATVAALTTNHLAGPTFPVRFDDNPWPGMGYGLGVGVQTQAAPEAGMPAGVFGWPGASGAHAWIYPAEEMLVLAMPQAYFNHEPGQTLVRMAYEAIDD